MPVNKNKYYEIKKELENSNVELVAVSKVRTEKDILELYKEGQRDFGENYVQELVEKQLVLPDDIKWHFIGHLQSNKAKFIIPFVYLIHGVDSLKLLKEISKQGAKIKRVIHCLLQVHIAEEQTKFGFNEEELLNTIAEIKHKPMEYAYVFVDGLMGMATFSDDEEKVRGEFKYLKYMFDKYKDVTTSNCNISILSMGMSDDYKWAIEEGSTMVRIGSLLFGRRS
jgi:pyridoxal phosphate enzyme (YggS family)